MIDVLRKLSALLDARERRRALQVCCLMLGTAVLQMLGVVSVMPFVMVLSIPDVVETNRYMSAVYHWFGFTEPRLFLLLLGSLMLGLFLLSIVLRAVTTYAVTRFTTMRLHTLSVRLLAAYLRQPYSFFLNRNTAGLGKSVLSEVSHVTQGVLMPSLDLLADCLVAVAIVGVIVAIDPMVSLIVAVGFGGTYGAIYLLSRSYLSRIGADRFRAERLRFVLASEALSGIKELQLMGRENAYLQRYREPSQRYAQNQAAYKLVASLPRYGIEALAFGGVFAIVLYLVSREGSLVEAMPLIVLYAMAASRLLPAFQRIYGNITKIRFSYPALESLYADLTLKGVRQRGKATKEKVPQERLGGTIRLQNLTFAYPSTKRPAVQDLSLVIPEGSSAAFVGRTGAGKSTTVDLIMGLLEPTAGNILVEGCALESGRLRAWQRNIGYVPQATYLSDDSITANIAFGIPPEEIDHEAVQRAARTAHIHDFVVNELPNGYQTLVGERGIRLSGGQRQRLAISRALYHDPNLVVFDEATSALDNATEAAVMEALEELRGTRTVIMIAHRLSTVKSCDQIFVMERGRLVETGAWAELRKSAPIFRELADVSP